MRLFTAMSDLSHPKILRSLNWSLTERPPRPYDFLYNLRRPSCLYLPHSRSELYFLLLVISQSKFDNGHVRLFAMNLVFLVSIAGVKLVSPFHLLKLGE